jgi:membrane protease YdiL (CAAX protease family)
MTAALDGGVREMPRIGERTALAVLLGVLVVWNLTGNLVLPGVVYVPANLAVATLVVGLGRAAGLSWPELGMARASLRRGLVVGGVAAVLVAVTLTVTLLIPSVASFFESDSVAADSTFDHWFIPIVRIPIGTAVFEELLFRGVLLGLLIRLRSVRFAVVASAVIFGLWHIVPAWESATGDVVQVGGAIIGTVAITTVAGVIFALMRVRSGSVAAPMLAHAALNSFAYVAAVVVIAR